MSHVVIIGAGPVGASMGVVFARHGWKVDIYDRYDMSKYEQNASRSINLVLTRRGLRLSEMLGLKEQLLSVCVPVRGRMLHNSEIPVFQPYGKNAECNYSIGREILNKFWVEMAQKEGVNFHFNHKLQKIDFQAGTVTFQPTTVLETRDELLNIKTADSEEKPITVSTNFVVGCDGAASETRKWMSRAGYCEYVLEKLPCGYKEIFIPAKDGRFQLDGSSLHIWPRKSHFLMALANPDGSFTGTIYVNKVGEESFESTKADPEAFWEKHYPTAYAVAGPQAAKDYAQNPVGTLGTCTVDKWFACTPKMNCVLAGDAAHAIVPFFGQGCNCGFEDAFVMDQLLRQMKRKNIKAVAKLVRDFHAARKPNGDAIAQLAVDNFHEMMTRVADPKFLLQKRIESKIECTYPELYRSRYALVVYSYNSYSSCLQIGEIQQRFLSSLLDVDSENDLDMKVVAKRLIAEILPELCRLNISLEF